MAKIKDIPCDIYRRDVQVFLGSHEEFRKYVYKKYRNDKELQNIVDDEEPGLGDFYYGPGTLIIRIEGFPTTPKEIGTASHEALHAAMWILNWAGVHFENKDADEALTYLQEWILTNILTKKGYKRV